MRAMRLSLRWCSSSLLYYYTAIHSHFLHFLLHSLTPVSRSPGERTPTAPRVTSSCIPCRVHMPASWTKTEVLIYDSGWNEVHSSVFIAELHSAIMNAIRFNQIRHSLFTLKCVIPVVYVTNERECSQQHNLFRKMYSNKWNYMFRLVMAINTPSHRLYRLILIIVDTSWWSLQAETCNFIY